MNYKIVLFGTKDTTIEMIKFIAETLGEQIDLLVTVSDKVTQKVDIAGFASVDETAGKYGIEVFKSDAYSLNDEKCKAFFSENTFEIGICMGWQRLIPALVLERFKEGIFGFHGSCGYLPFGRGRSPLNWSLLLGDKRFVLNLFKYDENADSPNVFSNVIFEINEHDTIRTLQYKSILCSRDLVKKLLRTYRTGKITIDTATRDFDSWYGKRTPADGEIDFTKRTWEIYNLIRSVTKPFAGAYCYVDGANGREKVIIWSAVPFDKNIDFSGYAVGEIIDVFDGNLVVRTLDGSLLITDYECEVTPDAGNMLWRL